MAMASKFAWALLMIVSMRVVGRVGARAAGTPIILGGVAVVFVITVLPISPGGAGVPELLYISFYTTYTGGADSSAITAGVMLFRAFQWVLPIPLGLDPALGSRGAASRSCRRGPSSGARTRQPSAIAL